jgi:serine/threonine-protein kinase RsbW
LSPEHAAAVIACPQMTSVTQMPVLIDIYIPRRHTYRFIGTTLPDFNDTVTMANRVAYTLDSTLDSVNYVEQTAEQLAHKVGFPDEDLHKITMSVREAAVNAVLHGNAYDPHKKITVAYETSPNTLQITITDQGRGLKETDIPDPTAEENILKTSGRGIFLIRSFMDEVRIRDLHPGTEITLVKHVTPLTETKGELK